MPLVDNKEHKSRTFSLTDLEQHQPKPERSIISEKLFQEGSMMVVGGAPKAYKSFVVLSLAISIATGRNLFGAFRSTHGRPHKVFNVDKPRRVLYIEQEIGEDDLKDRIMPLFATLNHEEQLLMRQNFFSRSLDPDIRFDKPEGMKHLEEIVREVKGEVVIFDPLIEFHECDENSPSSMAQMLKNFMHLARRLKLSVILTHHEGKDNGQVLRDGGSRLRGASSLYGKGDTFLSLSVVNRPAMRIRIEFTLRRGKPLKDLMIKLDSQTLEAKFLCWQGDKKWKEFLKPVGDDLEEPEPLETMQAVAGKQ